MIELTNGDKVFFVQYLMNYDQVTVIVRAFSKEDALKIVTNSEVGKCMFPSINELDLNKQDSIIYKGLISAEDNFRR